MSQSQGHRLVSDSLSAADPHVSETSCGRLVALAPSMPKPAIHSVEGPPHVGGFEGAREQSCPVEAITDAPHEAVFYRACEGFTFQHGHDADENGDVL
jgi:hypothetical protein